MKTCKICYNKLTFSRTVFCSKECSIVGNMLRIRDNYTSKYRREAYLKRRDKSLSYQREYDMLHREQRRSSAKARYKAQKDKS
jgi:hypothetical protein